MLSNWEKIFEIFFANETSKFEASKTPDFDFCLCASGGNTFVLHMVPSIH